jgi:DHA1 family inner membrane transport protein
VVARALAGAPAAWIVGMPVIGLVAEVNWRLAFLAVPLPAAVVTGAIVLAAQPDRSESRTDASLVRLLREPGARGWAFGEFLAMSSWAGMLVFSGALFVETYGASPRLTGLLLAIVALAYLGGNTLGGRIHGNCHLQRALARGNVAAAAAVALTWLIRPNLLVTLVLFSCAAVIVGARTVAGTAYGFALAGERKLEVGAARSALTHTGYLAGSLLGGAALSMGGHAAVGIVFGLLFLAATTPHVSAWGARCVDRRRIVWRGMGQALYEPEPRLARPAQ